VRRRGSRRVLTSPLPWMAVLFVALLFGMPVLAPVFAWAFPGVAPPVFERSSYFSLFLSHAGIVGAASAAAVLVGVGLAVFATRPAGRDLRPLIETLATTGDRFRAAADAGGAVPLRSAADRAERDRGT
jgi:osmoprotectant transport system permease protein